MSDSTETNDARRIYAKPILRKSVMMARIVGAVEPTSPLPSTA